MLMKLFNPGVLGFIVKWDQLLEVLVTTLVFVAIGLIVFGIAFFILEKVS